MKSSFFYNGHYKEVAAKLKDYINAAPEFLSEHTARSTRAAGDAIEGLIADRFDTFLGDWCKEYSSNFARRAMADVAFKDKEDFYCVVDVKTHREDTKFNMPTGKSPCPETPCTNSNRDKKKQISALSLVKTKMPYAVWNQVRVDKAAYQ